jgi:hypothetical protein
MLIKISRFTFLLAAILLMCQVWMSGWRVTDGDRLSEVQRQIAGFESENLSLKNQIYAITALENVSQFALETHMRPAQITTLSSLTVAYRQ